MIPKDIHVHVTEQDIQNEDSCPVTAAVSRCCKVPRDWVYVDNDMITILCSNGLTECIYSVPQIVVEFLEDLRSGAHLNTKSLTFLSELVEQIN